MSVYGGATRGSYGTVTTPAAGAAIATIASVQLPGGLYQLDIDVGFGPVAGVADGMELRRGGVSLFRFRVAAAVNSSPPRFSIPAVRLSGAQDLSVNAVGAGPVGSVYSAVILATPLSDAD